MKTGDYIGLGILGIGAIVAYNASKNLFSGSGLGFGSGSGGGVSNIFSPKLTQEQKEDWAEQAQAQAHTKTPEAGDWDEDFSYQDVEQSDLDPTAILIRSENEVGDLTTFKFYTDDLTPRQRTLFDRGFWDFEDGKLEFGADEGEERLARGGTGLSGEWLYDPSQESLQNANNSTISDEAAEAVEAEKNKAELRIEANTKNLELVKQSINNLNESRNSSSSRYKRGTTFTQRKGIVVSGGVAAKMKSLGL
jgi:hypothetical protein